MGIGGGSGGGGFKLEKTWRATGVGTTTFNTPSSVNIPFGKYEILVSGRGGTGNPNTPGTISSYNPLIPSTISGYNPTVPSTISGFNAIVQGSATGAYNPGSGGNLAGYESSGGNIAGYNTPTSPTPAFGVYEYIQYYESGFFVPGFPTSSYNPPAGGNIAGYNPYVPGSANYNAGNPTIRVLQNQYAIYYDPINQVTWTPPGSGFTLPAFFSPNCPTPFNTGPNYAGGGEFVYTYTSFVCTPTTNPGNIANYNPPSGGTAKYNPGTPGNQVFNPSQYQAPVYNTLYLYNGIQYSCPTPFTYFFPDAGAGYSSVYETVNFFCSPSPIPGSPGNANYNSVSNNPVFNPFVPGNQNYNSPTGGNPNYNAVVNPTANYNATGGQNANYNAPTGGTAGADTNVLGVYFPGGPIGTVAPYVAPTRINRYAYPDDATYPVSVPPGGYITIEAK